MKHIKKLAGIVCATSVLAFGGFAFAQDTVATSGQGDAKSEDSPSSSGVDNLSRGAPGVSRGSNIGTGRSVAPDGAVSAPAGTTTRTVR
jgi:hypothetical protein